MNTVAAAPMKIRHASLAIDRLRWGATDGELFLSADNICDSFRPSGDVPENQIAEIITTRTIQIPKSAYASQYPGVDSEVNL